MNYKIQYKGETIAEADTMELARELVKGYSLQYRGLTIHPINKQAEKRL